MKIGGLFIMIQVCACVLNVVCVLFVMYLGTRRLVNEGRLLEFTRKEHDEMQGKGTGNTSDGHLPCGGVVMRRRHRGEIQQPRE
jgi:hypothetical protein